MTLESEVAVADKDNKLPVDDWDSAIAEWESNLGLFSPKEEAAPVGNTNAVAQESVLAPDGAGIIRAPWFD